jgi:hypothetical protein
MKVILLSSFASAAEGHRSANSMKSCICPNFRELFAFLKKVRFLPLIIIYGSLGKHFFGERIVSLAQAAAAAAANQAIS